MKATVVIVAILLALTALPVLAQPEEPPGCGCAEPPPGGMEPSPPIFVGWLPMVSARTAFAELGEPPLPPEKPGALDRPVRPPTVYLPLIGGAQ